MTDTWTDNVYYRAAYFAAKNKTKTKMCISLSFPTSKLTIVAEYFQIDVFHSPWA